MRARTCSSLGLGWLTSFLLAAVFLPSYTYASSLADTARQLAHKIALASGPGAFAIQVTNRSSLDDKSIREVRSALDAGLHVEGIHAAKAEQAIGSIEVVFSESLREYVWTAQIMIGSNEKDEKKVAIVSLPRSPTVATSAPALPIVLRSTLLFAQEQPMLDVALVEMPGGARLLVLTDSAVAIYRRQGNPAGRWELEASLPPSHSRAFPRDLRGRLLLRQDHLFDAYLPGAFCRTISNGSNGGTSLTLACNDTQDPWPLTPETSSVRAFFATSRNFFTGVLSPGIGKISNVPAFYSAAALPRPGYTLWAFAAVDGSLHLVDGTTDQAIRGANSKLGSDLAVVHSNCGTGTQLLVSQGDSLSYEDRDRDGLRAFEIPDRDPMAVSAAAEFAGPIVALWTESSGNGAAAIVKRKDTGWYEAYRISISCGN